MRSASAIVLVLTLATAYGCGPDVDRDALYDRLDEARNRAERLEGENARLREQLDAWRRRAETLEALGGSKRIEKLYRVRDVELYRVSATDEDDDGVAETVKVRLRPIDGDGNILKAAGGATVRVLDLSGEEEILLSERSFSPEQLSERWYGGFGVYHYTLECPLNAPPEARELTVYARFTDYLTGKVFTAREAFEVPPPRKKPETRPIE